MSKVTFDYTKASQFISEHEVEYMKKLTLDAKETLLSKSGAGNDFLGWIDLPVDYDKEEFDRIKKAAKKIQEDSDVLLVIGIGGSYLGARAAIEFLRHSFYNMVDKSIRKTPEIYFVGNSISSTYIKHLIDVIGDRDFSINMISKSGTTTEPAIAFRVFKEIMEKKYGKEESAKRIYATTDKAKGSLKNLATEEGYETFVVPDDVGGRFSVLTAVGLLPIAVSGADIDKLMEGAASGRKRALELPFEENDAMQYAAIRNILLRKGKAVEILCNYEPSAHYVSEWWKQLFGESEGKDQKGLFPASVDLTTDLHSMGQFIQDGSRIMFETVLNIEKSREEVILNEEPVDLDGLQSAGIRFERFCSGDLPDAFVGADNLVGVELLEVGLDLRGVASHVLSDQGQGNVGMVEPGRIGMACRIEGDFPREADAFGNPLQALVYHVVRIGDPLELVHRVFVEVDRKDEIVAPRLSRP